MKGESARRAVASAEVGRGPDVRGAAVRQCGIRMDRGGAQRSVDPMKMRNVSFPNLYGSFFDNISPPNFVFS